MILDLDIGNTRVKWRLSDAAGHISAGSRVHAVDEMHFRDPRFASVDRIRVSSVLSAGESGRIADLLAAATGVQAEFAITERARCGVRNSYADVSRMGVDRWLAMLAGYAEAGGACCVIDAGTAVTLDGVDADGNHLGGYIVPGYATMRRSLLKNTGQVRMLEERAADVALGCATEPAVANGALVMLLGFIERGIAQCRAQAPAPRIILTGGDASMLAPHLDHQLVINQDLVLDGLAIALP